MNIWPYTPRKVLLIPGHQQFFSITLLYIWRTMVNGNIVSASFSMKIPPLEVSILPILYLTLTIGLSILLHLLLYSYVNRLHTYWNPLSFYYIYNPLSFITRLHLILQYQRSLLDTPLTKYVSESSTNQSTTTSQCWGVFHYHIINNSISLS